MTPLRFLVLFVAVASLSSVPVRGDEDADKKAIALGKAMDVGGPSEKIRVAGEFAKMGDSARAGAKYLAKACTDTNPKVSVAAFEAMEKVWPEIGEAGLVLMSDKEEQFNVSEKRAKACQTLLDLNVDAGVPFLLHHLRMHIGTDSDAFRVNSALSANVDALKKLAPDDATFHKTLVLAAGPTNQKHRNRALAIATLADLVETQSKLRKDALPIFRATVLMSPANPQYRNGNREQLAELRAAAVAGLGSCGKDARSDLARLKELKFKDDSETVRKLAGDAATRIESDPGK